MKKPLIGQATCTVAGIMAAFWAYTVMDTLIREYPKGITLIDLLAIFLLGLVTGLCFGGVLFFKGKKD
ncbi:MAG TPA: hypothetical protein PK747_06100 [Acidobacteriota bacterium]|nr:hypothetical protein [Acidobacteriota bacterium]HNT18192.1 hypothetical protein [Acidobacteriota bacterium]HQO19920.1 hypothetical protein [Acidobacteriota bacterium]HQQ46967.1 hypothetical protein [Acidobacteriota bacterium]